MAHDSVICATFNLSDWLCEFRYSVFCLVNLYVSVVWIALNVVLSLSFIIQALESLVIY